jgi:hypothetical protein
MSSDNTLHQDKEPIFHRLAKGFAAAVAECTEAQRMLFEQRLDPEHYVFKTGRTPDSFAEFMIRTSGTLRHEPSARERAFGPPFRP